MSMVELMVDPFEIPSGVVESYRAILIACHHLHLRYSFIYITSTDINLHTLSIILIHRLAKGDLGLLKRGALERL